MREVPAAATGGYAAGVLKAIREAIVSGEFVPGQRLVEVDLSAEFGASRGAVRSALVELAAEGLVDRIANRGARVRVVSLQEAIEIYEVRMALEALCAAKAASNAGDDATAELRRIGERMRAAVADGDVMSYRELNQDLHAKVIDLSGQQTAAGVLERLRAQNVRQQFKLATTPGRPQVSLPEHLAIIDAISGHNPAAAERAVKAHLTSVMEAMRRALKP